MVRIDITMGKAGATSPIPQHHLHAAQILRYLITDDPQLSDMIILGDRSRMLVTTDKEVYEALGSVAKYDVLKPQKLTKLFENVRVYPYEELTGQKKPILTFEKVEELRKEALRSADTKKNENKKE